MYTDTFDALKAKQRALDAIRKQNKAAARAAHGRLWRLFPRILGRDPVTPLQECLAVHMYCAAPHSAME
jgi:hypothetical protein